MGYLMPWKLNFAKYSEYYFELCYGQNATQMKGYKLLHSAKIPENLIFSVKHICEAAFLHFYILQLYK